MSEHNTSTRRSFLKGGALLAAPIAAAAVPAVALAEEGLKGRVQRLEDEAAIRELHQTWLRRINAGQPDPLLDATVRRVTVDDAGAPDRIEVGRDGRTAVGSFACRVETETPLAADGTLAQMARAQGNGTVHRSERRTLTIDYTKESGVWKIGLIRL